MFNIDREKNNKIVLTRGDSASILVEIYDLDNNKYEIQPDDIITMTIIKPGDSVPTLTKWATPEHYIIFEPSDTEYLDTGIYEYDVELQTTGGNVYTIVVPSLFKLTSEITYGRPM